MKRSRLRSGIAFDALMMDEELKRSYRMSKAACEKLLGLLRPYLKQEAHPNAIRSAGRRSGDVDVASKFALATGVAAVTE